MNHTEIEVLTNFLFMFPGTWSEVGNSSSVFAVTSRSVGELCVSEVVLVAVCFNLPVGHFCAHKTPVPRIDAISSQLEAASKLLHAD